MRDEYTGYVVLIGLFCFCVLVVHWCRLGWDAFRLWRQRVTREKQEKKAAEHEAQLQREKEEKEAARTHAEEQAKLDRKVLLFSRLSIEERRMLLQWYTGKEKNHRVSRQDESIAKLEDLGYIYPVDFLVYCLSDSTCDLLDARYNELKAQLNVDEIRK